jgi:hypothetical protein
MVYVPIDMFLRIVADGRLDAFRRIRSLQTGYLQIRRINTILFWIGNDSLNELVNIDNLDIDAGRPLWAELQNLFIQIEGLLRKNSVGCRSADCCSWDLAKVRIGE